MLVCWFGWWGWWWMGIGVKSTLEEMYDLSVISFVCFYVRVY